MVHELGQFIPFSLLQRLAQEVDMQFKPKQSESTARPLEKMPRHESLLALGCVVLSYQEEN